MAEKITDRELVEELKRFGETVSLPFKLGKRQIYIKKLNHHKSKANSGDQTTRKSSKRAHLDVLSSDDSDFESAGQTDRQRSKIVSGVSKSLRRRSTANTPITPPKPKPSSNRVSLGRPSLRSRKSEQQTDDSPRITKLEARQSTSRLYPDLSDLNASGSLGNRSRINETFESSDSDLEESTYEVENKSVNTTFTIESNNSLNDGRSPNRSHQTKSNTTYSNHVTPVTHANSKRHTTNHTSSKHVNDSKKNYKLYPEHVSGGLLVIVGGFFLVLAVSYLFVRKDVILAWYSGIGDVKAAPKSTYLLCLDTTEGCYGEPVVEKTMIVIRDLYDVLSSKKGLVVCGSAEEWEKNMSVEQFRTYVKNIKNNDVVRKGENIEELVKSCLDHIVLNPHWNIRAVDKEGEDTRTRQYIKHLESNVASMALLCRLQRSFYRVTGALTILIIGCVLVFMLLKYLKWRSLAKEQELRHVYAMVDEIIDILKRHHDVTQGENGSHNQFLAVQHVRDQLLPPSRRKELQPVWDKAVLFIEKNESRIRLEEQTIEGEEFRVWRWIHNSPNGGKVWQGQAFGEHNDDSSNTVMYCPTPCLKIRNMFDADVEGEDPAWEVNIQDALLEKCKNIDSIFHIFVDKESREGCVYMKCSCCEAAGRARQALHGWWFDRRLVTVRYLKLDYYHNRFPDSVNMKNPLLPSTNQMSSLSQPFYRSSLEMT
ncbi:inner nuclear membrane protein Man1-like isoform X1 [Haliotis rufescens]|uniref:inner nuclear membrane protein Man1-like isoform X1 n=1 Tax=Haliotis rufescens TaxID=6454 RepID=UPI00201F0A1D|nr:inner nuclear membrane protein Man1-like isoform X1 [Haliotis rufescens]